MQTDWDADKDTDAFPTRNTSLLLLRLMLMFTYCFSEYVARESNDAFWSFVNAVSDASSGDSEGIKWWYVIDNLILFVMLLQLSYNGTFVSWFAFCSSWWGNVQLDFESCRQTFNTIEVKSTEIFIVFESIFANCRNVQPGEVFLSFLFCLRFCDPLSCLSSTRSLFDYQYWRWEINHSRKTYDNV